MKLQAPVIPVTQAALPPLADYMHHLAAAWERHQLTNNGPLAQQLAAELRGFLDVPHLELVASGTVALQLAIRALGLTGEIITTPFSYVATTAAILWEHCRPVFVDIDPLTGCLDAALIEAAITPQTQAILATHVYGYPCDVLRIEALAQRYGLKVIYDGAHAFGTRVAGRSVLSYGDLTACSFHATKLYHTGEGGAVIAAEADLAQRVRQLATAGTIGDEQPQVLGTNAKLSELHAAMGLSLLPQVPAFIAARAALYHTYSAGLVGLPLRCLAPGANTQFNYAYFPVVFASESQLLRVQARLAAAGVGSRRYFRHVLNQLPYHTGASCPLAENMAQRVLCLPFYAHLPLVQAERVAALVRAELNPTVGPTLPAPASYPVAYAVS